MARGEHFGGSIHVGVLVEETAHIAREVSVFGLPGSVQRSGSLLVGAAYFLPTCCSSRDEGRKHLFAPRNGNGLFVGAAIGVSDLATPLHPEARAEFDQRHA